MEENKTLNPFSPGPEPTSGSSNTGLKIAVGLLAAVLVVFGIVGVKKYKDFKGTQIQLEEEKQALINDLEELKVNYDNALQENTELKAEIEEAKTKVENLIAELKNVKAANLKIIRRYKNQLYALKKEKEKLFQVIDSLKQANQLLAFEKDSLGNELTELSQTHEKVLEENKMLAEVVLKAKTLAASNINVHGVKIKKSGKIVDTRRAKRAQQIRVCASIPKNPVLEPGSQTVYVQVVNPNGEVIGSKDVIQVDGEEKIVSASKEFHYDGEAMDICVFVIPENKKDEIIKGGYQIILYHNGQKIGESSLELK
jgi:regulator of replication initiation timing